MDRPDLSHQSITSLRSSKSPMPTLLLEWTQNNGTTAPALLCAPTLSHLSFEGALSRIFESLFIIILYYIGSGVKGQGPRRKLEHNPEYNPTGCRFGYEFDKYLPGVISYIHEGRFYRSF